MADCTQYYRKVIDALAGRGIHEPSETFWAGVFVGICEQVMMKVKPAGMMGSEMPRGDHQIVADVYGSPGAVRPARRKDSRYGCAGETTRPPSSWSAWGGGSPGANTTACGASCAATRTT